VVFEVPVGSRIKFDYDIRDYNWFNVDHDGQEWNTDNDWDNGYDINQPEPGREYLMTSEGKPQKMTGI
jgi:hypothetical protein